MPTTTTGSASAHVAAEPLSDIGVDLLRNGIGVLVDVEVPTGVPRQREGPLGVVCPPPQRVDPDPVIVAAADGVDVGADRDSGRALVTVEGAIVAAHRDGGQLGE